MRESCRAPVEPHVKIQRCACPAARIALKLRYVARTIVAVLGAKAKTLGFDSPRSDCAHSLRKAIHPSASAIRTYASVIAAEK